MEKLKMPVVFVSLLVFIYAVSPFLGFSDRAVFIFFLLLPVPVIWMVLRILKDGTPSSKKWDEYFYEDNQYIRNGKEEVAEE
jgi:hypothetical protein